MNRLLKAGVMEKGNEIKTFVGTPQGGIVSPLLFNIYMFELYQFVLKQRAVREERQEPQTQSQPAILLEENPANQGTPSLKKRGVSSNEDERVLRKSTRQTLQKEIRQIYRQDRVPSQDIDSLPSKVIYAPYADDLQRVDSTV